MTTNIDLTNRALAQIGSRSQIASMTDGSTEALYANLLYDGLRDFMLRQGDFDWSMQEIGAHLADASEAPQNVIPWVYTYDYPASCIKVRQLIPETFNVFDPKSLVWNILSNGTKRFIVTLDQISVILYTVAPPEDLWDSLFTESFVRLLGSSLHFALQNRVEASKEKLQEALEFAALANIREP